MPSRRYSVIQLRKLLLRLTRRPVISLSSLLNQQFATANGTSVINAVLFEVFEPLQQCSSTSPDAVKAMQKFIAQLAAHCNPQETLTLFMSTLGEASE